MLQMTVWNRFPVAMIFVSISIDNFVFSGVQKTYFWNFCEAVNTIHSITIPHWYILRQCICNGTLPHWEKKQFDLVYFYQTDLSFYCIENYLCKTSSISHTNSQNLIVSSCSCLRSIHWSQVLSWEWRCSWSSADRRCSNYIWVINNLVPSMVQLILEVLRYCIYWTTWVMLYISYD